MVVGDTFDYTRFLTEKGSTVARYVERYIYDPGMIIPDSVRVHMLHDFGSYDEYHLVYAIELSKRWSDHGLIRLYINSLEHRCQAVRIAAYEALLGLRQELFGAADRAAVCAAIDGSQEREAFIDLATKMRAGD